MREKKRLLWKFIKLAFRNLFIKIIEVWAVVVPEATIEEHHLRDTAQSHATNMPAVCLLMRTHLHGPPSLALIK